MSPLCASDAEIGIVSFWFILLRTSQKPLLERKWWIDYRSVFSSLVYETGVSPVLGTEPTAAQLLGPNKSLFHWSWSRKMIDWKLPNKTTKNSISWVGVTGRHADLQHLQITLGARDRKKRKARALRPLVFSRGQCMNCEQKTGFYPQHH